MKKYTCYSDIGSVLVGNKDFQVALPNIGGDGYTTLEIYDKGESVPSKYEFISSLKGKFNVYSYDCSNGNDEDIIATLSGRYGIWSGKMTVALQRWE